MTTYSEKLNSISRIPISYLRMSLDYCANTYGVSPCGATASRKCYNTYPTCRSRADFSKLSTLQDETGENIYAETGVAVQCEASSSGNKIYEFTSNSAPLPFKQGERPYIRSIAYLPTEIKDNLTINARMKIEMADEPDSDVGIDPYLSDRSSVQGTFWKKLIARNMNFKGRICELYDGFYGMTAAEFMSDSPSFRGALEEITLGKGTVTLEIVDLLKALDKIDIPEKINLAVAADMTADQTYMVVVGSGVSSLTVTGGYLKIDSEIVSYTTFNSMTYMITGLTRARFGTTAATHTEDAAVKLVKYYEPATMFEQMQTILADAGIDSAYIDTAAFAAAESFDEGLNVWAVIHESTKASTLYFELVDLACCKSWVSEDMLITIARELPNHPDRTYTEISDAENIILASGSADLNQESRVSRCSVYWDLDTLGSVGEYSDYSRLMVAVDAEAESSYEYSEIAEKEIMSRWLHSGSYQDEELEAFIMTVANRHVWPHRDPMAIVQFSLELKDSGIKTGDYIYAATDELLDIDGSGLAGEKFQVVKREKKNNVIILKCLRITGKRICYFAPEDAPDYADATEAEREKYGYFCDEDGFMSDGAPGYVFY